MPALLLWPLLAGGAGYAGGFFSGGGVSKLVWVALLILAAVVIWRLF